MRVFFRFVIVAGILFGLGGCAVPLMMAGVSALTAIPIFAGIKHGNERVSIPEASFRRNYRQIKAIVVEEATNNGFGKLDSEVQPSKYNNWQGSLYFAVKTGGGTDNLTVKFERKGSNVEVWVSGASDKANAASAAKAIVDRLGKFGT